MAVYKVIQDIEAEDKLIGFLTLKTFIYALIAGAFAFICVRLAISTSLGSAKWGFILVFMMPVLVFGILAAPIGKDQPTEVWILSHVKFFLGKHTKVWDQSGIQELVTITVPKAIERHLTKDFSQDEVRGRLKALASTLDSRGWAVRNVVTDIYGQPGYFMGGAGESDRLVGASTVSQPQQVLDVHPSDDILDEQSNATAQKFSQLMQDADSKRKQSMLEVFEAAKNGLPLQSAQSVDYRFLDTQTVATAGTSGSTFVGTNLTVPSKRSDSNTSSVISSNSQPAPPVQLGDPKLRNRHPHFDAKPSLAEEAANAEVVSRQSSVVNNNQDASPSTQASANLSKVQAPDSAPNSVKMELSKSDDLSVASVAQLANHHETVRQISPTEVEISLH